MSGGGAAAGPDPAPGGGGGLRRRAAALGSVAIALAAGAGGTFLLGWAFKDFLVQSERVADRARGEDAGTDVVAVVAIMASMGLFSLLGAWFGRWVGDGVHEAWGGRPRRPCGWPRTPGRRFLAVCKAGFAGYAAGVAFGLLGMALADARIVGGYTTAALFLAAPTLGIIVTRAVQRRSAAAGPAGSPGAAAAGDPPAAAAEGAGTPAPAGSA